MEHLTMVVTRDTRRDPLTLMAGSLGLVLVMLNVSMVNPALPAICVALGGGGFGQQWAVNAYNLVFASLLLLGGLLGDRYGHRRVERGDAGVALIKDLTDGLGAHSVVEAVGTQEAMLQAIQATRPGGQVGFVGVAHGVELNGMELFLSSVLLHGDPAPVRRFLPELIDRIWTGTINSGKVFDLTLPLDQVAEGYRAMDERRAIKTLLLP
jgi:hypothetical protein